MMKQCVLLDGKVINIGEWNHQIEPVVVVPAEYGEDGTLLKEALVEHTELNPLPEGAVIAELECEQDVDGGWYAVDYAPQIPASLEAAVEELKALKKRTDDVEASIYALIDMV